MKNWLGRLIAYVFLGSFCLAGPLLLILALGTAVQRAALLAYGYRAEATVIGVQASRSSRPTYAPVFQFQAADGRSYVQSSDVYGAQSAVRYGERLQVLYWPNHPESARIDAFAPLWTLSLITGAAGTGFSIVPAIVLVAWMRRRAAKLEPIRRTAAESAADTVSRRLRRALGALLIGVGVLVVCIGLGIVSTDSAVNGSRVLVTTTGILLAASGMQVGQWAIMGSRLSYALGSVVITGLAVMFGWVALYGDAANFHGSVSVGGVAAASAGSATTARILFGAVSILVGLAALWSWRQTFRPR